MMAGLHAGELGARVVLIEKNKNLGTKFLLTGGGRCNITNKTDNLRGFINKFGKNGNFLFSALSKFGADDTIDFFEKHGIKTKIEKGQRVSPLSNSSLEIRQTFINYLKKFNVEIKTGSEVKDIIKKNNRIEKVILKNGEEIFSDKFILCTGGKSYPMTGSTGDGYKWLKKMGHTITDLSPAICSVIVKEKFVKDLEGLSLKNVEISVFKNNKKIDSRLGEAIFTADGMSGPIVLDLSKKVAQELPEKIILQIDFNPTLDFDKFDKRLQEDFKNESNKMFKNVLGSLFPPKLVPVIIKMSDIDEDKKVNLITKQERKKLLHLLKSFKLEIKCLSGFDKAIITSGGVKLSEIDPKTMRSKIIENLYFAGEILDLDGPTGGYNLQVCWSTGYVAGECG